MLLGCGDQRANDSPSTTTSPATPTSSQIELHRTGGLAGVDDRLTISHQGHAQLVRTRPSHRSSLQLSPDELTELRRELEVLDSRRIAPARPDAGVADTFQYTLDYGSHTLHFDDTTVPEELAPAFDRLSTLIGRLVQ